MARIIACRYCRIELEAVTLKGARAMLVCVTCEQMGFADEIVRGAPLWRFETVDNRRPVGRKPRISKGLRAEKKLGKKSLTA
jgi:hypothetical protein